MAGEVYTNGTHAMCVCINRLVMDKVHGLIVRNYGNFEEFWQSADM